MKVIYKNNTYRFVGYDNIYATEVLAERGGKFYCLPVKQCKLVRCVTA